MALNVEPYNIFTSFQLSPMERSPKTLCVYMVVNNAGHIRKWLPRRAWKPF